MDVLPWLTVPAGLALALLVVVDVFVTIVHPDLEGRLARGVQLITWRCAVSVGDRWTSHRRGLLALAGPLMTALTFFLWVSLFILAVALLVWPFLDSFRAEPELEPLGLLDALYFAGASVTVLGYGDITPKSGPLKLLAVASSGMGFALFTGIITYLMEVVSGIDERNRFALRVHDETGGERRGAMLAVRCLEREDVHDLRQRYDQWAATARNAQDRLHRYAHASLFYRSRDRVYDPVPALRAAAEAAMAGYLLAEHEQWSRLAPAAEHLDLAVTRLLGTVADQYLGQETHDLLESPDFTAEDHRYVRTVSDQLCRGLGDSYCSPAPDERSLALAFRCRVTLTRLDDILHWTREEGAERPWEASG
jgi:hypothetical protein